MHTQKRTHRLTDTGGRVRTPHLAVLAGCRLLALQTEPRGTEELTARVEIGAVRTLVATVGGHVQLGTADLCQRRVRFTILSRTFNDMIVTPQKNRSPTHHSPVKTKREIRQNKQTKKSDRGHIINLKI